MRALKPAVSSVGNWTLARLGLRANTYGSDASAGRNLSCGGNMIIYYSKFLHRWVIEKRILGIRVPVSRYG